MTRWMSTCFLSRLLISGQEIFLRMLKHEVICKLITDENPQWLGMLGLVLVAPVEATESCIKGAICVRNGIDVQIGMTCLRTSFRRGELLLVVMS